MKTSPFPVLFALALAGCSDDAIEAPAASPAATTTEAAAAHTDPSARVRLGIVFTDADPWMAGAILERGTLRIGDRLFLLTRSGQRIRVQLTAIRDDATQAAVNDASAPQDLFLSFRPESLNTAVDVGSEALLVGDSEAVEHAVAAP